EEYRRRPPFSTDSALAFAVHAFLGALVVSDTGKATWYRWDDLPRESLHERLSRRLVTGDRMMLAHVYLKKGCVVPRHSHENEQFTYILEGALRVLVGADGAEEIVVRAGEVLHLPAHLPHEAHALEDTLDVDVFSPTREDWLNKTDAYLRGTRGVGKGARCAVRRCHRCTLTVSGCRSAIGRNR